MINDSHFFRKFILHPKKIGSITPSSTFLTKKMLGNLPWQELDTIVELGAGTGVFSDYIACNKKKSCQVLLIEQIKKCAKLCRFDTQSSTLELMQKNCPGYYMNMTWLVSIVSYLGCPLLYLLKDYNFKSCWVLPLL